MKPLFSIALAFLFTGCIGITPEFPDMPIVEPTPLSWEDIEHQGRRVHALTPFEWQKVQHELIDRRHKNNTCADIVNKYMEDYK